MTNFAIYPADMLSQQQIAQIRPLRFERILLASGDATPISVYTYSTLLIVSPIGTVSTSHVLGPGTFQGQIKEIVFDGAGSSDTITVVPSAMEGAETSVVFVSAATDDKGRVVLMWTGHGHWIPISVWNAVLA